MTRHHLLLLSAAAIAVATIAPIQAQEVMRLQLPSKIYFTGGDGGDDNGPPDNGSNNGPLDISWSSREIRSLAQVNLPVTISGGTPPYAVDISGLPNGLTFDPVSRTIVGQTTQAGLTNLTFTITDANNGQDTLNGTTLTVLNPLFAQVVEPDIYAGEAFSFQPSQMGVYGTATWDVAGLSGLGLTFNPVDGRVSGTLPSAGEHGGVTFGVTDSHDGLRAQSTPITLRVQTPVDPVATITPATILAYTGRPISIQATATDARAPAVWTAAGTALPAWASVDESGILQGTPTAVGTTSGHALRVTGANNRSDNTEPFSIQVASPYTISLPSNGQIWRQAMPRTLQLSSSASSPTYTKVGGAEWLSVSSSGEVSGNPPAGSHSLTVRATQDGWAEQTLTVNVYPNITFTTEPGGITMVAGAAAKTTTLPVLGGDAVSPTFSLVNINEQPVTPPSWLTLSADGRLTASPSASVSAYSGTFYLLATDQTGGRVRSSAINVTISAPPPAQQFDRLRLVGSDPYNYDGLVTCIQTSCGGPEMQFNRLSQYSKVTNFEARLKDDVAQSPASISMQFRSMEVGSFTLRLSDGVQPDTDLVVTTAGNAYTTRNIPVSRSFNKITMFCTVNCQVLVSRLSLVY